MRKPAIKICGMKLNTAQVAQLGPDYLGFIFYEKSPRFFIGPMPDSIEDIKRVGVFVNSGIDEVLRSYSSFGLDVIQLHGDEPPAYCRELLWRFQETNQVRPQVWKAIAIGQQADFGRLEPYEDCIDRYLFDTASKVRGGSGLTFNWKLLGDYPSQKSFVLSGGIGMDELAPLKELLSSGLPVHAIDLNSRFELAPGLKDVDLLKDFMNELQC